MGSPFPIQVTSTIDVSADAVNGSPVDTQDYQHLGLILPAAFTGTALTFEGAVLGANELSPGAATTWAAINDKTGAAPVTVDFVANKAIGFSQDDLERLLAFRWIRPVSNGTEAADRAIVVTLH